MRRAKRIGARGDFTTAPEISQIFGELLGLWCAQLWHDQGRPTKTYLVEFGPGRGTLIGDALRALRSVPAFLETVEIVLVEASAKMEEIQRAHLRDAGVGVRWLRQWNDIARDRPLFLLANEFLDALPVHQFVMTERGWCERIVDVGGKRRFALSHQRRSRSLRRRDAERRRRAPSTKFHRRPRRGAGRRHKPRGRATGGAALFIDYGHAAKASATRFRPSENTLYPSRSGQPGRLTDISAHVDFAALAESARRGGGKRCGTGRKAISCARRHRSSRNSLAAADPARCAGYSRCRRATDGTA